MRLIDADALPYENMEISETSGEWCLRLSDIENAPTVDAVPTKSQFRRMAIQLGYEPVVRCNECIHADEENCPDGVLWCNAMQTAMLEEGYCSHGERRNDER